MGHGLVFALSCLLIHKETGLESKRKHWEIFPDIWLYCNLQVLWWEKKKKSFCNGLETKEKVMVFHRALEKQLLEALIPGNGSQGSSGIRELCKVPGSPLSWPLQWCCVVTVTLLFLGFMGEVGFPGSTNGKEPACQCRRHSETQFQSLGWEDLLEKVLATHSSILAWRIPWTQEPGGLYSIWSQWVRHNWVI